MTTGTIQFIVDGNPVPKQSYRAVKGGGYTSPRVKAWQTSVAWRAREAMAGRDPIKGPVSMHIVFVLTSNRRVDLDNLSKNVLDGCNGIVFVDDNQVVNLHLVKHVIPDASPGVFVNACAGGVFPALADNYGLQIPP